MRLIDRNQQSSSGADRALGTVGPDAADRQQSTTDPLAAYRRRRVRGYTSSLGAANVDRTGSAGSLASIAADANGDASRPVVTRPVVDRPIRPVVVGELTPAPSSDSYQHALTAHQRTLTDGHANGTINHHSLALAIRYVRGGRQTFLTYVYGAAQEGESCCQAFWYVYANLTDANKLRVDLDDIAEAAGVRPHQLIAATVSYAMRMEHDTADLVAASLQTSLVRRTAKSAMRIGGKFAAIAQKDREMLLQHSKFLPMPRGMNVNVRATANAAAAAATAAEPALPSFTATLASADKSQRAAQDDIVVRHSAFIDADVVDDP